MKIRIGLSGSVSSAMRYFSSSDLPTKEKFSARTGPRRDIVKRRQTRVEHDLWFVEQLPHMVDALCKKMYDERLYRGQYGRQRYTTREEFYAVYAPLIIDRRKVADVAERVRDTEKVVATAMGLERIYVDTSVPSRPEILLTSAELEVQRRLDHRRQDEELEQHSSMPRHHSR